MIKFVTHKGIAAPLLRNNVDTDAIIPSREMKTVSKVGLTDGLFAAWRYTDEKNRTPNPDFVLNQAPFNSASILMSGNNFGCGSSREHAVWALKEFGFRCLIAESFGNIFMRNCVANGILPICLDKQQITNIALLGSDEIEINLEAQTIKSGALNIKFDIAAADKEVLLNGLDPIDITLKQIDKIQAHHAQDRIVRPWLYS